jgi:ABC-2 type transport system permease protein
MDATDPNTARLMLSYTQAVLRDVQHTLQPAAAGGGIVPVVRMRYNPEMKSIYVFVPGLMAFILMLICALMTSITISREKERGTMEVLLVSPLQPLQIVVGKVVPYLALSFLNVVTILILARLVFGVPVRGNVALLLAEALLFILAALALGVLISTQTQTQLTAMMISLAGLMLPTLLLSGFIFPLASMPWPLQLISHIVPAKWFLIIVKGILLKGAGLDALWRETLILVGMTVAFIGLSVRRLNIRLE